MRTHSRHALGLVLLLLLAAVLSGCFRSAGGSLEPTPVAFDGGMVAQQTPVVLPSLTPTVADIEPTTEIATELKLTQAHAGALARLAPDECGSILAGVFACVGQPPASTGAEAQRVVRAANVFDRPRSKLEPA